MLSLLCDYRGIHLFSLPLVVRFDHFKMSFDVPIEKFRFAVSQRSKKNISIHVSITFSSKFLRRIWSICGLGLRTHKSSPRSSHALRVVCPFTIDLPIDPLILWTTHALPITSSNSPVLLLDTKVMLNARELASNSKRITQTHYVLQVHFH